MSDINKEAWDMIDNPEENEEIEEIDEEQEENEEEKNEEESEEEIEPQQELRPLVINGRVVQIDNIDELYSIAERALTEKETLEPYKDDAGLIEALKENDISDEEINMLIDAKKGKKEAIKALMKRFGVSDVMEMEDVSEEGYKPNDYRVPVTEVALKRFVEDAQSRNPEAYTKLSNFIANELDDDSKREVFNDMELLKELFDNAANGLMEAVAPIFMKKKLVGSGKKALDIYAESVKEYIESIRKEKELEVEKKQEEQRKKSTKRKKAAAGGSSSEPESGVDPSELDFMSMSDEEFEKYYRQIVG